MRRHGALRATAEPGAGTSPPGRLAAWVLRAVVAAALAVGALPAAAVPAAADDGPAEGNLRVPDVRLLTLEQAVQVLRRGGFAPGRVYEVVEPRAPLGTVLQQRPDPRLRGGWPRGWPVDLRVSAARSGPPDGVPYRPPPPSSAPAPAPPASPAPPPPAGDPSPGGDSSVPPPAPEPAPEPAPPAEGVPAPSPDATGSPDAPTASAPPEPGVVPALRGLPLADAETLARAVGLTLYVDRVPGHPVGRVLSQEPDSGTRLAAGAVVKVRVTAGGDAPGEAPPPPEVEVRDVVVPEVLDRLAPQARRILEDVGLVVVEAAASSGPPGRVVDQVPRAGEVAPKGSAVRIRIAPGEGPRAAPGRGAPAPGVPAPAAAPVPLAPAEGTEIPAEATVPIGFTWRGAPSADAYVLEVEEKGPDGWLPNARRVVRTTAALVEVERVSGAAARLRWRVRAVASGREGPPSAWVALP